MTDKPQVLNNRFADTAMHDPEAVKDYQLDWAKWFTELNAGDTITASSWAVYDIKWQPATKLSVDNPAPSHTDTTSTVWVTVTGALPGEKYFLTNHVTTAQGRQDDQSIIIKIKEM